MIESTYLSERISCEMAIAFAFVSWAPFRASVASG
jgi:hypothetical protein